MHPSKFSCHLLACKNRAMQENNNSGHTHTHIHIYIPHGLNTSNI